MQGRHSTALFLHVGTSTHFLAQRSRALARRCHCNSELLFMWWTMPRSWQNQSPTDSYFTKVGSSRLCESVAHQILCSDRGSESQCDRSFDLDNLGNSSSDFKTGYALLTLSAPQGGYPLVAIGIKLRLRPCQAERFVFPT